MKTNRIIFLMITLMFLFFGCLYAQTTQRLVKDIEVINNKIVTIPTILSKIQTKKDKEYSPVTLSDDIKRLYATGLFNDVSADIVELDNGVKVVFKVQEKPVLKKIEFKGNQRLKTKKLSRELKIKKEEIFDKFKLKEDIEELKRLYAKKGYALAKIEYDVQEKENQVTVTINIDEGQRIRIKKISFQGNDSIKSKILLKVVKTKKKGFFNSGFFKEDVLEEDMDRISGFYHASGYIDIQVSTNISYGKKGRWMFVRFDIQEGKQYKVGSVQVTGNSVFTEEELQKTMDLLNGAVYSEGKLRQDTSKIQSRYFDEGYIGALVKADTILNPDTGNVDLSYALNEGNIAYVDKINIGGNDRTKDVVIRREMRLYPGDRYNGEKLRRSRQRLLNLGYFEEATFDTVAEPTTLPDKYDLNIFVKEKKTGQFSFGAGYSSLDGPIGFIDLTQSNFDIFNFPAFAGAGQRLRMRMEFGSERQDYELGFVEPWFLGYPVSVGFNIYSRTRDWDKYDEKRIGGNIFVGRELAEYWRGKLTYRYEGIRISEIVDDVSDDVKQEEGKNYISSLRPEIVNDTRDDVYNPRKGIYNVFSCEYAGGVFGGDKDFIRYEMVNYKYFPIAEASVFELRSRLGMVEAYEDSEDVPIYERFYAGGATTIRGYKERRVGPEGSYGDPIGGRIRAIFNAEFVFPLAETLKWAFFYDIGNVWADNDELSWDNLDLKRSIGTGMRLKTPLGPIRLDYGYALDSKPGDAKGRFHFSMSHEF